MHLYLSPWVGPTDEFDPIQYVRPLAADRDFRCNAIDLRPDPTSLTGWCVAAVPEPLADDSGLHYIGTLDAALTAAQTRSIETNLGLDRDVLLGMTPRQVIVALMTVHADDARADRWNVLRSPAIYLGELIWEEGQ